MLIKLTKYSSDLQLVDIPCLLENGVFLYYIRAESPRTNAYFYCCTHTIDEASAHIKKYASVIEWDNQIWDLAHGLDMSSIYYSREEGVWLNYMVYRGITLMSI